MRRDLWEFKYAPSKFEGMVLHADTKIKLEKVLDECPNIILSGSPGVGKGTFVNIYKRHTKYDFLKINASDETGIDNIRDKVKTFATAMSMPGEVKIVFLNEADYLSHNAQAMLRDLMEQVQKVTRFVLACNYDHKLIPELKSRCQLIKISNPPAEQLFKFACGILNSEKIVYDKKTVVKVIKQCHPDIRKTIVTLRENTVNNELSKSLAQSSVDKVYVGIINAMKECDPEKIRNLLRSNSVDYVHLYKQLYETLMGDADVFTDDAQAIILVGEHSYRNEFAAIKEINFMHMIFRMMQNEVI